MPPLYDQLFDMTLQVCATFPGITPLTLRQEDADEVITLFCRFMRLAKRKDTGQNVSGQTTNDNVVEVAGSKYRIVEFEDKANLRFGG